jgi:hypothetical protein
MYCIVYRVPSKCEGLLTSCGLPDKKENQIFLIYKEIQNGAAAKSYMTNGLLMMVNYLRFLICNEALPHI